jgi:hypothetical protein
MLAFVEHLAPLGVLMLLICPMFAIMISSVSIYVP